jgi:hypothetical protein
LKRLDNKDIVFENCFYGNKVENQKYTVHFEVFLKEKAKSHD